MYKYKLTFNRKMCENLNYHSMAKMWDVKCTPSKQYTVTFFFILVWKTKIKSVNANRATYAVILFSKLDKNLLKYHLTITKALFTHNNWLFGIMISILHHYLISLKVYAIQTRQTHFKIVWHMQSFILIENRP